MGKSILIVDDSSIMRKMIRQTLEKDNHTVVGEAKNGKDAIDMYVNLKPDVVTMDITMRDMDGFAAAKEILAFGDRLRKQAQYKSNRRYDYWPVGEGEMISQCKWPIQEARRRTHGKLSRQRCQGAHTQFR